MEEQNREFETLLNKNWGAVLSGDFIEPRGSGKRSEVARVDRAQGRGYLIVTLTRKDPRGRPVTTGGHKQAGDLTIHRPL